jgi:uncharacterized membrane protein YphA (DoxX/SURF4 family)
MSKIKSKLEDIKPSRLEKFSYIALRLGLGITYIWIGVLMTMNPSVWGGFFPEIIRDLSYSKQVVIAAGFLDFLIGLLLIINRFTPVAALASTIHMSGILIVYGLDSITVRDIGLLGASISVFLTSISKKFKKNNNET